MFTIFLSNKMTKGRAIAIAIIGIALTTILTLSIKYGKDNIKVQQVKADTTTETIPTEYLQWETTLYTPSDYTEQRKQAMINTWKNQLEIVLFDGSTNFTIDYTNPTETTTKAIIKFENYPIYDIENLTTPNTWTYKAGTSPTSPRYHGDPIKFKYIFNKQEDTRLILTTYFNDNMYLQNDILIDNTFPSIRLKGLNSIITNNATITSKLYAIKPNNNTTWYILDEYYTDANSKLYSPQDMTGGNDFSYIQQKNQNYSQDPTENQNLGINLFDKQISISHSIKKIGLNEISQRYNFEIKDNNNYYEIEDYQVEEWTLDTDTINTAITDYMYNQNFEYSDEEVKNRQIIDTQIEVANIEVENFNEQINSLQNDITDLNAEKEELNDTISSLNSQKDNLATEIENLETEKEELETTITSLNSQIATLESNVEELEQDNADLSDQIDELEISVNNLTSANTTLQNQLNAVSVDKTELQATITTLNTEIDRLESIIENLTLDNEDIEEQLATAQATITSLNATITTLNTQKTNLENSITSLQANYDELSEEYETLETIKNNINDQLDALQEDFNELTASYEEFRNEYGEYVENYENILTAYRELLDTGNGVVDIKGIMFDTLSMPFVFINKAFDITLFSGTAFAINIANLIKDILALLAILFLFGLFKKGLGAF